MESLFKSPIVKAFLAFLVVLIMGLTIWYIGPMLTFDKLRPLENISVRVTLIVLLIVLVLLLYFEISVLLIGVSALCLLIWHAGALVAFGGMKPLEAEWIRAVLIGVVVFIFLVYSVYSLIKMFVNDPEMAKKIFNRGKEPAQELAKEEVKNMFGIAKQALAQLKAMRLGAVDGAGKKVSVFQRLLEGKRYLYELPWYMIIGNPATGKTTALLNSGLKFPMNHQMGGISSQSALANNSGTLNCAWWFTNDAVLVDTAGRFTAHGEGEDKGKHAAQWRGFLGVLRKARPRAPINGVVVALDVAELIALDEDALVAYAAVFRARLEELRTELGIRFPVYVMVTKTDLLKGFSDYFTSLTAEGRSQVWGFTLPWADDRISFKFKKTKSVNNNPTSNDGMQTDLANRLQQELLQLQVRLEDGVNLRLQEEFEVQRRTKLYALPQEFGGLSKKLSTVIESLFADSRFDSTQLKHSLRGVYFTSCHQVDHSIRAEAHSLWARLESAVQKFKGGASNLSRATSTGQRSYFASDVLQKIIFPEAHLVKPNLRWETRFRFLRMFGHAIVGLILFWLMSALVLSYSNNKAYLSQASDKTHLLSAPMAALLSSNTPATLPDVLTAIQAVSEQPGLETANPSSVYTYGLYTASPIVESSNKTYAYVQDNYVVPVVVKRIETVLSNSVAKRDAKTAYDALRIYLMLHEKDRYKAGDVKEWVLKDWQDGNGLAQITYSSETNSSSANYSNHSRGSLGDAKLIAARNQSTPSSNKSLGNLATIFDGRVTMIGHLETLFSGERLVQSATTRNEILVKSAQNFLGVNSSSERLYERAKASLNGQTPEEFTLVRAVGPQVGTLFTRISGTPLEKGIPGLFTYEGYHEVFSKQLPLMIAAAQADDAWVMGAEAIQKKRQINDAASKASVKTLTEDIRRQYLIEYQRRWTQLLEDIRPLTGGNLMFDLNVLRQLAAPDSPLARLGKVAAKETSLSKSIATKSDEEKSFLDKASDQLEKKSKEVSKNFGIRPESRLERELVDNYFSALREIVTGQSDGVGTASAVGKAGLENITGLLNEYYTTLVIADMTIAANTPLPVVAQDPSLKVKLEAGKLPAPFKEILLAIAMNGSEKVAISNSNIIKEKEKQLADKQAEIDKIAKEKLAEQDKIVKEKQAEKDKIANDKIMADFQAQKNQIILDSQNKFDSIINAFTTNISETCKRGFEQKYPFYNTNQEVLVEDFNIYFSSNGSADDFFTKNLAEFVDTSSRPWKYKKPILTAMSTISVGSASTPSAMVLPTVANELNKLLIQSGPNPEHFYKISQIRDVYFKDSGGKRLSWKMDIRVADLDSTITELIIDLDGQIQRYSHGPVQALSVTWPGPKGGLSVEITANPKVRPDTSSMTAKGPWSILRLLERGKLSSSASANKAILELAFDGRKASLDISSSAGVSLLNAELLKNFRCPARI
jgi:type VI secretion system protein ImpL